jgi:hypothetical protein
MKKRLSRDHSHYVASLALITLAAPHLSVSPAHAELVYEAGSEDTGELPLNSRESERDVLEVAQSARDTRAAARKIVKSSPNGSESYEAVNQDSSQVMSESMSRPSGQEVEHLSRSELLRRERIRQEMRNEDILQERLEELRLRDEKRREEELMGAKKLAPQDAVAETPSIAMQEEVVSQPAVLEPTAPAPGPSVMAMPAPVMPAESSTSLSAGSQDSSEKIAITVAPRGGISAMSAVSGYTVQSRYSAGIDLSVAASDHVSFGVGYVFSEYGVLVNSSNPWVYNLQWYTGTQEAIAMKQNVIDATLKLHLLGPEARIRPYLGGGAAWSKSFINYDQRIIDGLFQSGLRDLARDYEAYSILGSVSTGIDVRITKSISVGAQFKYYTVLTSRENQGLNNAALAGYYSYGYPSGYWDADKQVLGGSLARSAFYSITGGLNFSF